MEKQQASVMIYKRENDYFCDATGCFGGGFSGAFAGTDPEAAALFAIQSAFRYINNNNLGGNMYLPAEVREALKNIKIEIKTKIEIH